MTARNLFSSLKFVSTASISVKPSSYKSFHIFPNNLKTIKFPGKTLEIDLHSNLTLIPKSAKKGISI